jgi:hypothetical protein
MYSYCFLKPDIMKQLYPKNLIAAPAVLSLFLIVKPSANAQVPQGFNYQAIARDGSGNPITGATISVRLSILTDTNGFYGSGAGVFLWEETHSNVKTNAFGLFTVVLGNPAAIKFQGTAASLTGQQYHCIWGRRFSIRVPGK